MYCVAFWLCPVTQLFIAYRKIFLSPGQLYDYPNLCPCRRPFFSPQRSYKSVALYNSNKRMKFVDVLTHFARLLETSFLVVADYVCCDSDATERSNLTLVASTSYTPVTSLRPPYS